VTEEMSKFLWFPTEAGSRSGGTLHRKFNEQLPKVLRNQVGYDKEFSSLSSPSLSLSIIEIGKKQKLQKNEAHHHHCRFPMRRRGRE
jgi:hypothetical protein